MTRYAANILLEYNVKEAPSSLPLCERRIVVFRASGSRDAIRRAKWRGKRSELSYRNADGQTVQIRFIGLIDVISLDVCDEDEAYYSLRRTSNPKKHVRPDSKLSVLASGLRVIGSSRWALPEFFARAKPGHERRKRNS